MLYLDHCDLIIAKMCIYIVCVVIPGCVETLTCSQVSWLFL